jgi:hypothetical protein
MDKDKLKKSVEQWRKKLKQAERYQDAAAKDLKIASLTVVHYKEKLAELAKGKEQDES